MKNYGSLAESVPFSGTNFERITRSLAVRAAKTVSLVCPVGPLWMASSGHSMSAGFSLPFLAEG